MVVKYQILWFYVNPKYNDTLLVVVLGFVFMLTDYLLLSSFSLMTCLMVEISYYFIGMDKVTGCTFLYMTSALRKINISLALLARDHVFFFLPTNKTVQNLTLGSTTRWSFGVKPLNNEPCDLWLKIQSCGSCVLNS